MSIKSAKPSHSYPPTRELWSLLWVALGAVGFWVAGSVVRGISIRMSEDPVLGCASVGCAPGLISLASLFLYGIGIVGGIVAYFGLLTFLRRPIVIGMFAIGALWGGATILRLSQGFLLQSTGDWVQLLGPVFLIFSGLFAIWIQSQPPKT